MKKESCQSKCRGRKVIGLLVSMVSCSLIACADGDGSKLGHQDLRYGVCLNKTNHGQGYFVETDLNTFSARSGVEWSNYLADGGVVATSSGQMIGTANIGNRIVEYDIHALGVSFQDWTENVLGVDDV